ncbi:hypothetical protein VTJ49DRAFT_4900 [Mycothermus thermophilus]|uniref:N-acetyltransferase domain-containing protein n=1 Tax=Humicola insolens TaxID=85995 RepID=A0ABR3V4E3_HUMIN
MPAILDDPATPTIYRVSGDPPFPDPANPSVPPAITPRHVTLRDRQTVATVVPFASRHQVPESLLAYLCEQFNKEIEGGDTYPMMDPMSLDKFASYWFQNFGGIMLLGHIESAADVVEGKDWSKECLGTFYIKPNYPGRSSHICNAGFIVTDASRNRGVGRLMGETYLDWAPKLGYKYSVFNLVYETNVASCKIWDALGFKRIGRVKGAGNLKSHPDRLVDAIIYGRDLGDTPGGPGSEELVSEERFDKIKFYLKTGRYPNGADRAEKSRLRSAATHYKLLDGDILMLKDKEVISDPQRQYEIARSVHNQAHGGINKTTATIAERYHWSRIKETVSDVIRNCAECKDTNKTAAHASAPSPAGSGNGLKRPNPSTSAPASKRASPSPSTSAPMDLTAEPPRPPMSHPTHLSPFSVGPPHHPFADPTAISLLSPPAHHHALSSTTGATIPGRNALSHGTHNPMLQDTSHGPYHASPAHAPTLQTLTPNPHTAVSTIQDYQPIDPAIIAQSSGDDSHLHPHHHHQVYQFSHPSPPPPPPPPDHHHHHHPHHSPPRRHSLGTQHEAEDAEAEAFRALINAAGTDDENEDSAVTVGTGLGAHDTHHHNHIHEQQQQQPAEIGHDDGQHHITRPKNHQSGRLSRLSSQLQHPPVVDNPHPDPSAVDRDLEMLIDPHHVAYDDDPPHAQPHHHHHDQQQQQPREHDPSDAKHQGGEAIAPSSTAVMHLVKTDKHACAGTDTEEDPYADLKPPPGRDDVQGDVDMDGTASGATERGVGEAESGRMDLLFYPPPPEAEVVPPAGRIQVSQQPQRVDEEARRSM